MLSYRHAFHAGNHADVLKHLSQVLILRSLCKKAKPFVYIDTHSGAGAYSLVADEATKTAEYATGVEPVMAAKFRDESWQHYHAAVGPYFIAKQYPGSPAIALGALRASDRMMLIERHNQEIDNLKASVAGLLRNTECQAVAIHHRDGFEALVALSPPEPKRGLVLIDPSYELQSDYSAVTQAVRKSLRRWSTGIFAIWYPLLGARANDKQRACDRMIQKLQAAGAKQWLDVRFLQDSPANIDGMYGSGMFIINPPWQLDQQLEAALAEWAASQASASYVVNRSKEPNA